jgi:hypothetical protein
METKAMKKTALLAVAVALPFMAAAQQDPQHTGSIPRTDRMTEQQVRHKLESAGYNAIGMLELDSEGVWRTTAMKGDEMMSISVSRDGSIEDR